MRFRPNITIFVLNQTCKDGATHFFCACTQNGRLVDRGIADLFLAVAASKFDALESLYVTAATVRTTLLFLFLYPLISQMTSKLHLKYDRGRLICNAPEEEQQLGFSSRSLRILRAAFRRVGRKLRINVGASWTLERVDLLALEMLLRASSGKMPLWVMVVI